MSTATTPATRRKFATPPVKAACTACRAARVRCDGKEICTNCVKKSKECIYLPSKRGGPRECRRRRKEQPIEAEGADQGDQMPTSRPEVSYSMPASAVEALNYNPDSSMDDVFSLINPGAGLTQLEDPFDDSDLIFDSIFWDQTIPFQATQRPVVRTYTSDLDLLESYYIFIHSYFPILPTWTSPTPPADRSIARSQGDRDESPISVSPVGLAIAAILTLIPHESDMDEKNQDAIVLRRQYSYFLAQSAVASIELDSESPISATEPSQALSQEGVKQERPPFHPAVPVELEGIIALDILSTYEYAQRGNISRMRLRAGQALVAAMDLSLHCEEPKLDEFTEARRRVWWMTYSCTCQGAIVSSTMPTICPQDPNFTTPYPSILSDNEAWPFFVKAQQMILAATQFVNDLNKALAADSTCSPLLCERARGLSAELESLICKSDSLKQSINCIGPVDAEESIVAGSLITMSHIKLNSAKIKLHRYSAFYDHPIFSRKHCDLKTRPSDPNNNSNSNSTHGCSCGESLSMFARNASSMGSPPPSLTSGSSPTSSTSSRSSNHGAGSLPFSSHQASKACLKGALSIAQAFEMLPYPFVVSTKQLPRTMPSMCCCAMQSAYALLMIRQKTQSEHPEKCSVDIFVQTLFSKVHKALCSVSVTLENFAISAEAIGGMRDQIRECIEC